MAKYTKKDLVDQNKMIFLPYINMVMKDITIKKDIKIIVGYMGELSLTNTQENLILFRDFEYAINSITYYNAENYEDVIELEEVIVETKELQFKKGSK